MNPYQVSTTGVVTRNGKVIKTRLRSGYPSFTMCLNNIKRDVHVHRFVAETYLPNPNKLPQVNHIDGNKLNNDVSNLEWVTAKQNMVHAVDTGLINKDNRLKRNPSARYLSLEQANEIRAKYVAGSRTHGARALGREYGIPHTAVLLILDNKTYTH